MNDMNTEFAPFEQLLDQDRALTILRDASVGSDDGELFIERCSSESFVYDDQRLQTASYNERKGFGLRAVAGEVSGYAHASTIDEPSLKRAAETVSYAVRDGRGFRAPAPPPTNLDLYPSAGTATDSAVSAKIDVLKEIDAYLRSSDNRVVQASATLSTAMQEVVILRPDGSLVCDTRPMARIRASVILEEDGRRESGSEGAGGRFAADRLMLPNAWKPLADEALRIARVNLKAKAAPAGVMDVVLGPGWPGILLHEAIGHGLEGDFNRKQSSAFAGLMGKRIASPEVTVLDDGTLPEARGSINVDDEGTPAEATVLIEDGILVRYMQDRQNARLMDASPTGNGRRQSYAHSPMPRMTNTYMLDGNSDPADIIADLKDGIYATGFSGGQVDITNGNFVFSCTEAYRVRNGEIGQPIKNATLIGDGASALQHIRAIGNDLELDPGIGTCGKGGQWVPVNVGLPTVCIGGLTVGGVET